MFRNAYKNAVIPAKNHRLLFRNRLDNLLSEAVKNSLVTVIAGAGYGKTQAVSMFLRHNNYKASWMQLSNLDNLPIRFWERFLYATPLNGEAIERHRDHFPESLLELNQFLHTFTEGIHNRERLVFVFDDLHLIHNESVINFIHALVAAKINNLCIVLMSRTNISFNKKINNSIIESDLRFTLAETKEYLKMLSITLSTSEIKKIQEYTEGWTFAIYLLTLDLQNNNKSMIDSLANIKLFIFQMIETEIFSSYTHQWQKLLIKLSLLNEFPAELLYEFTDSKRIYSVIKTLNKNMFIYYNPYNEKYYFHQIFLDFLTKKQVRLEPQVIYNVYLTAALWYSKHGASYNAITYYEKCKHYDKIWSIILSIQPHRHPKDKASFIVQVLSGFPERFVKKNQLVRVVYARYMFNNLNIEPAEKDLLELIAELSALPKNKTNLSFLGEAYIVLGLFNLYKHNRDFIEYFKKANTCLPEGSMFNYSQVRLLDINHAFVPGILDSKSVKRQLKDISEALPYISKVMHGFGYGVDYALLAEYSFFTGNLVKAQEYIFESIYRAQQKAQHDIICNGYSLLIRINAAKGNYEAIMEFMNRLKECVQISSAGANILDIAESWFYLLVGQYENIAGWILSDTLNDKILPPISIGRDRILRAYYFLDKGRYDELLAFTKQLEHLYQNRELWVDLISVRLLKAIALRYTNNMAKCVSTVQLLYKTTSENHFIIPFVELGKHTCMMFSQLKKVENHGISEKWLDFIISKATTYTKRQAYLKSKHNSRNLSDNSILLTQREKDILKELCQGLTREEISDCLHISVNTVKSILKNVYSKLGATNSADAVRIALQMNLI